MQNFRNLAVWQKAHELVLFLHTVSNGFPTHETYGLRTVIRRKAVDVPTRIADGSGCATDQDFVRHLYAANSAASELDYLFILVRDLKYIDDAAYEKLTASVVEVKRMLLGLIRSINP
ncbi:MAG: four helix bundle protein [Planctomycetota bacterium]